MLEAGQGESLERRKRRNLVFLAASLIVLAVAWTLRLVPRWNDLLAGHPQYARAMTTLLAQEFAKEVQDRFPVILLGEDDRCDALPPTVVPDDQVASVLYLLTYSEREHFSCVTTCAVPVDASKFANLHTIRPEEGWTDGPRLLHPVKVLPIARSLHVHSPSYLRLLHWRVTPRFPMSEAQAAGLAAKAYESAINRSVQPEAQTNINLDLEKLRALVRKPHDKVNFRLSLLLVLFSLASLYLVFVLFGLYRKSFQYLRLYEYPLTIRAFLVQDLNIMAAAVRSKYYERQREMTAQQRKEDALRHLRQDLELGLRSALESLRDEDLRQRIEECLSAQMPDLDRMKQLWEEVQEELGHKTPEERLALLLESLKPYCTDEEFNACHAEALAILAKSGFRPARKYTIARHDQFRLRAREQDELEDDSELAGGAPRPDETLKPT